MKMKKLTTAVFVSCVLPLSIGVVHAERLSLEQVIQKVVDHYPSIKTAAMQLEQARQENKRIQSQLGWQLNAQAGISHNLSLIGSPVDTFQFGGGVSRLLESGDSMSLNAAIAHDDADTAFATLPNPSTSTSIDFNYRMPLQKGKDNPAISQGLISAQAGVQLSESQYLALYDQLAAQMVDLFYAAANTQARITNSQQAIKRTLRLQSYIKSRADLGVSEEKDLLQVRAQLKAQQAEQQALKINMQQQQVSINRLTGLPWDQSFSPVLAKLESGSNYIFDDLFSESKQYSPALKTIQARLQLADSQIQLQRDNRKDQLDLVMFLGDRDLRGDITTGDYSENELVGGVSLEFGRSLDLSGRDAELYQAQLERGIALQDQVQVYEDLHYNLASILTQIRSGEQALKAYRQSMKAEQAKLKEAEQRYRDGRTDTDQLIQFENQLAGVELAVALQQLELGRLQHALELVTGRLWTDIQLPQFDTLLSEGQ